MLRLAAWSLFVTAALAGTAAASSFVSLPPSVGAARSSIVQLAPPAAPSVDPMPTLSLGSSRPTVIPAPTFVAISPSILVMLTPPGEREPEREPRARASHDPQGEPLPQVIRGGIVERPGDVERPAEEEELAPETAEMPMDPQASEERPAAPAPDRAPRRRDPPPAQPAPLPQALPPAAPPTGVPM